MKVDDDGLTDVDCHALRRLRLEARLGGAHAVDGGQQAYKSIGALAIRRHSVLNALVNLGRGNGAAGDDGAGRIGDSAFDVTGGANTLRECHTGGDHTRKRELEQIEQPHKSSYRSWKLFSSALPGSANLRGRSTAFVNEQSFIRRSLIKFLHLELQTYLACNLF